MESNTEILNDRVISYLSSSGRDGHPSVSVSESGQSVLRIDACPSPSHDQTGHIDEMS